MSVQRLSLALLALLAPPVLAQGDSGACCWQSELSSDGSNPSARHEAAYVELGGQFYLLGGRGNRPVDAYDPQARTWTNLGLPPQEMHHFQPVVHDGKIWVLMAFTGLFPNETPIPHIWTYEPGGAGWVAGPTIPAARRRGSAGVVVHDDQFYVVGGNTQGHNGGFVPWVDRYDPATDTWTTLPDAPHARDHFTAACIGHRVYVAGGRQTQLPNVFLNTVGPVDVYDISTHSWSSTQEPLPTERAGTMAVASEEFLVVIGGETTTKAHNETEVLNALTGEWSNLPDLLQARHSGGAVRNNGAIFVCAGAGANGGTPELNSQERLDLTGLLTPSALNLVANGDFDAGLSGWIDHGDLSLVQEGDIAPQALELENGHTDVELAALALETYRLEASYQVLVAAGTLEIGMQYLDGGGQLLGEDKTSLGATSGWTSFLLDGTTPAGTATLRLRFTADLGGKLLLDDVVLRDKPSELIRLGVPANSPALLPSPIAPKLGATWMPRISHANFAQGALLDFLVVGVTPFNVPFPFGTILVDPTGAPLFSGPATNAFQLPIPNNPNLIGAVLVAQGASIVGLETFLTNALDVTLQGF